MALAQIAQAVATLYLMGLCIKDLPVQMDADDWRWRAGS